MDIIRAILDGLAISAIFNGAVATLLFINPRFFLDDYPKGIQKASPTPMTRQIDISPLALWGFVFFIR